LLRAGLALLVAALLCLLLTRHIVAPVRALTDGARRLAAGDLGIRVLPAIAPRRDELAEMARAFDTMADRIEQLVRGRQALLADISHELRSPLTRLSVSVELLRLGESDVIEQMETDLARMNEMIGQILLLTRLELQPMRAGSESVDLGAMLASIAQDAEFEVRTQGKEICLEAAGEWMVRGDANLLRSCLENVVRNAVRYTEPATRVSIQLSKLTPERCEIRVRDCGPGVPEEALPQLFDPFFRVSRSRDHDDGGTGLGLAISQRVVQLHGGFIAAANRTDARGLEVTLVLPEADTRP
jgi:two-component system sensor histidine kinase CpxA